MIYMMQIYVSYDLWAWSINMYDKLLFTSNRYITQYVWHNYVILSDINKHAYLLVERGNVLFD